MTRMENETPSRLATLADLPLSGGGEDKASVHCDNPAAGGERERIFPWVGKVGFQPASNHLMRPASGRVRRYLAHPVSALGVSRAGAAHAAPLSRAGYQLRDKARSGRRPPPRPTIWGCRGARADQRDASWLCRRCSTVIPSCVG